MVGKAILIHHYVSCTWLPNLLTLLQKSSNMEDLISDELLQTSPGWGFWECFPRMKTWEKTTKFDVFNALTQ